MLLFVLCQVTFFMMPLEIGWAATVYWKAGDVFCRVMAFFRIFGLYLSGFVLVCLATDRWVLKTFKWGFRSINLHNICSTMEHYTYAKFLQKTVIRGSIVSYNLYGVWQNFGIEMEMSDFSHFKSNAKKTFSVAVNVSTVFLCQQPQRKEMIWLS